MLEEHRQQVLMGPPLLLPNPQLCVQRAANHSIPINRLLVTHNHVRMSGHDVIAHTFLAFLVTNPMLMLVKWSGLLALSAHCSGWLVADETHAL